MTTRIYAALDYTLLVIEGQNGNWSVKQYFDDNERPYSVAVDPATPEALTLAHSTTGCGELRTEAILGHESATNSRRPA